MNIKHNIYPYHDIIRNKFVELEYYLENPNDYAFLVKRMEENKLYYMETIINFVSILEKINEYVKEFEKFFDKNNQKVGIIVHYEETDVIKPMDYFNKFKDLKNKIIVGYSLNCKDDSKKIIESFGDFNWLLKSDQITKDRQRIVDFPNMIKYKGIYGYCPFTYHNINWLDKNGMKFYMKSCKDRTMTENVKLCMETFGLLRVHLSLLGSIIVCDYENKEKLFEKWNRQFSRYLIGKVDGKHRYYLDVNGKYHGTTDRLDWLNDLQDICRKMMNKSFEMISGSLNDKMMSVMNGINTYKFKPALKQSGETWTKEEYDDYGFQYVYIRYKSIQRFFESIEMFTHISKKMDLAKYKSVLSFGGGPGFELIAMKLFYNHKLKLYNYDIAKEWKHYSFDNYEFVDDWKKVTVDIVIFSYVLVKYISVEFLKEIIKHYNYPLILVNDRGSIKKYSDEVRKMNYDVIVFTNELTIFIHK